MIENNGLYNLAKDHVPQSIRNQMRSTARSLVDVFAGVRGLNPNCALPDFLIVGAQKAGTTSLFNWLVESDLVQEPLVKEVGYFDARWHWPIKYRGYFKARQPYYCVGEATPSYLAFPEVPERVHTLLGSQCKIIIVLRDPVSRSVSQYFHERRLGFEDRDMHTAMLEEDALIEEAFAQGTSAARRHHILTHCSYVYRSHYTKRLAPWFAQFNKANIMLLKSEEMFHNPLESIAAIADFLSVPIKKPTQFEAKNTNSYVFEDSKVAAYLQSRLSEETQHYNNWSYQ